MLQNSSIFYEEIPYHNPKLLFECLQNEQHVMWLDSADHSRYSYLTCDPLFTVQSKNQQLWIDDQLVICKDPFTWLEDNLPQWAIAKIPQLPPLQAGFIGYFGYELYQHLEKIPLAKTDPLNLPDMFLGFYDGIVAFDHVLKKCYVFCYGFPEKDVTKRKNIAKQKIKKFKDLYAKTQQENVIKKQNIFPFTAMMSKKNYLENIAKIKKHIIDGDIYQANFAHCFSSTITNKLHLANIYLELRNIAQEPFCGYLDCGPMKLLASSPERFLHLENRMATSSPIKGTIRRGTTIVEDEKLKKTLAYNEKDRAENIMIVDLVRNDLSKVCLPNSISVPQLCEIESFTFVHHLVSTVQGYLASGENAMSLLRAAFPGGSITGAPKIKAIEIIANLENIQRGPYCGAFGYISCNGDMDLAMTIRTLITTQNEKQTQMHFFVGGAITADSDAETEYEETLAKAEGVFRMIQHLQNLRPLS